MIDKYNIPIQDKNTKIIDYTLYLDSEWWYKSEYDSRGNLTYYVSSLWAK